MRGRNEDEPELDPNGAGKSSIWGAVCWCLFGKTQETLRNPDVIPWVGKGKTHVATYWEINEKNCVITRSISPNLLQVNGKEAAQEYVEELIGLNFDAFTSTLLLGQEEDLFLDRTPRDKMELLSYALNLERWDARSKHARDRVATLESKALTSAAQALELRNRIKDTDELLTGLQKQAQEWSAEREKRLNAGTGNLDAMKAALNKVQVMHDAADLAYDEASTKWRRALEGIRQANDYLQMHASKRSDLRVKLTQAETEAKALRKELDSPQGVCPTCGQTWEGDKAHKAEMQLALKEVRKSIKSYTGQIASLDQQISELEDQRKEMQAWADENKKKSDEAESTMRMHRVTVVELETKIKQIKDRQQEQTDEVNPYNAQLKQLQRQIQRQKTEADELDLQNKKLSRLIERTKYWVKGFKDIRLSIIEDFVQEYELTLNSYLDQIGLVDWKMQLDVEKETKSGTIQRGLNVKILSGRNSRPARWESWSGGEKQRLRLIGALALSDTLLGHMGVNPGFEVLDEPTQRLSPSGINDLCDLLADRARQFERQVWLIENRAIESAKFNGSLLVVRDNKGSRIESRII